MNIFGEIIRYEITALACTSCNHPILLDEHILKPLFNNNNTEVLGIVAKTENLVIFLLSLFKIKILIKFVLDKRRLL